MVPRGVRGLPHSAAPLAVALATALGAVWALSLPSTHRLVAAPVPSSSVWLGNSGGEPWSGCLPATSQGQQSSLSLSGNPDPKSRNELKKVPGSYLDPYLPSIFRRTCL